MPDSLRALYVDDEPGLLEVAKMFLEQSGDFSIETIESATGALELLKSEQFDAIISDYQMPCMDGIEFLKEVRNSGNSIPFILFTGKGREEIAIQAIDNGADYYLQKGGDPTSQFAELAHKIKLAVSLKKAEQKLTDLASIVENSDDAIIGKSPDGIITSWNTGAERIYGYSSSEAIGKSVSIIIPAEKEDDLKVILQTVREGKSVFHYETKRKRKDGILIDVSLTSSPIKDPNGSIIGVSTIGRDITRQKIAEEELRISYEVLEDRVNQRTADLYAANMQLQSEIETRKKIESALQESEAGFRALIEKAPEAILLFDVNQDRYIEANEKAEKIFGCSRQQLLDYGPQQFYSPDQFDRRPVSESVNEHRKQALAGEELLFERRIRNASGEDRVFEVRLVHLPSPNKKLIRSSYVDITERKKTELVLQRQTQTLSILNDIITAANNSDDLPELLKSIMEVSLHLLDFDAGGIYLVNRSARTADVIHSKNLPVEFLAEIRTVPIDTSPYDRVFIRHEPIFAENYAKINPVLSKKYGFHSAAVIPLLAKGEAIGAMNITSLRRHVITEEEKQTLISIGNELGSTINRMAAEEEAKTARNNLETLFNSINEMVFVLDMQGNIQVVNNTVSKRLLYSPEELSRMNVLQLHVPERQEEALRIVQGMIAGTMDSCPVSVLAKDGTRIEVETKVTRGLWNNQEVLIGVTRDVTERRQAEEALRESEEKYRVLFAAVSDGIVVFERETGLIIDCNDAFPPMYGYRRDEVIGLANIALSAEPDATRKSTQAAETIIPLRYHRRKDGSTFPVQMTTNIMSLNGRDVIIGAIRDITEQKRAEAMLADSEERFRGIFDMINDGIQINEFEPGKEPGKFLNLNDVACRMLQYTREELMNLSPLDITSDYHNRPVDQILGELSTRGYSVFETEHRRKDGTLIPVEIHSHIVHLQGENVAISVIRDITERKRDEYALQEANKKLNLLSSITRHDINNQLTVLIGFLSMLKKKQPDSTFDDYFRKINTAAGRISDMIQFTGEYESIGVAAPAWQDVHTLVDTAAQQAPPGKVTVKNDLPGGLEVFADLLIIKVFYNLMDNAARYGGTITTIRFFDEKSGDDHLIVCEDDGAGIPADEKEQIFGRGFGRNTGMGLFLAREILAITGITITETGTPGKGARFEVKVPDGMYRS
jgi:PAS domain S-box-containing protein